MGVLDLPEDLLHGIKIQFGSGPTIMYKLAEQININILCGIEYFEFKRKYLHNNEKKYE